MSAGLSDRRRIQRSGIIEHVVSNLQIAVA